MNDCLFCFLSACDGKCPECPLKYISANSEDGGKILQAYEDEVNKAAEPIRKKYVAKAKELIKDTEGDGRK